MRLRYVFLAQLGLLSVTAPVCAAGSEGPAEAPVEAPSPSSSGEAPVSPEQVEDLIAQLDSSDFRERKEASRELARAGVVAVRPLAQAAGGDNLEVTARAMEALHTIYNQGDDATLDVVEDVLEQLVENENVAVASRARLVLDVNSDIRERRAVAEIERLGGMIEYGDAFIDPNDPSGVIQQIRHVVLGKSWSGGDDGLKYVQRLPQLKSLYVVRSQKISPISKEAQEELAATMPNLLIQERGAACLGVGGGDHPQGCQIIEVKHGSAADEAGLQEWDIITSFGGEPATSFKQLVELIAKHEPGEAVDVEVIRGSRSVDLEVVMGDWESLPTHERTPTKPDPQPAVTPPPPQEPSAPPTP